MTFQILNIAKAILGRSVPFFAIAELVARASGKLMQGKNLQEAVLESLKDMFLFR